MVSAAHLEIQCPHHPPAPRTWTWMNPRHFSYIFTNSHCGSPPTLTEPPLKVHIPGWLSCERVPSPQWGTSVWELKLPTGSTEGTHSSREAFSYHHLYPCQVLKGWACPLEAGQSAGAPAPSLVLVHHLFISPAYYDAAKCRACAMLFRLSSHESTNQINLFSLRYLASGILLQQHKN